jgi:hypothetical protein
MKIVNVSQIVSTFAAAATILACAATLDARAGAVCTADPDAMAKWYGIAGGPVGSDAIARTVNCAGALRSASAEQLDKRFGRAGGPVGADAIAATAKAGLSSVAQHGAVPIYGRAGYPVGAEAMGLSTATGSKASVAQDSGNATQ